MSAPVYESISALEQNLWSQWSQFGRAAHCGLHDRGGILRFDTPIQTLPYNGVLRCGGVANIDGSIKSIIAHYGSRRVPFMWIVHPTTLPSDLESHLQAHGFKETEVCPGMITEPRTLARAEAPPHGVKLREITPNDDDDVLTFLAWRWQAPYEALPVLRDIFGKNHVGRPGAATRGWVATQSGRIIAKAFTHRTEGVVGLYGVATKPEARGVGVGRALCLKALHESVTDDTRVLILHSTAMAASLYKKMGFREVATFKVYVRGAEFHA